MTKFVGAQHDLASIIKTHLFVICPNNSGSTFLGNALATSPQVWALHREGQHVMGFQGPNTLNTEFPLIWGAKEEWLETFLRPNAYDWEKNRKVWYFQATSYRSDAPVFCTRTPPFLLVVDQLLEYFENTKLIFMVRNPYAVVEGIVRRKTALGYKHETLLEIAATHIMKCFEYQKRSISVHSADSIFFTYEAMCADPEKTAQSIMGLVPDIPELNLNQSLSVKGMYDEHLRNMNEQQIDRLTSADFRIINRVFEKHVDLLENFGYEVLGK